jgi:putative membrane protein
VATLFLVAIVMVAVVKESMSWLWGLAGLVGLMIVLMAAIKIYKSIRENHT